MKELGTLRQLILRHSSDEELSKMFDYLYKRDKEAIRSDVTREWVEGSYTSVVFELLNKPMTTPYDKPIFVSMAKDDFDPEVAPVEYVDVSLLNPNYVPPAEGLEPWGCRKGEQPPTGYYDANDEKHIHYYAFGFCKWSEVIDTPVLDETGLPEHEVLAEILWEMTFYGWTEKDNNNTFDDIKERCARAMKDIEEGKFIELPKTTEKGYDVRIPDSVLDQLKKGLE